MRNRKKGFTLIELIAVLVILATIVLIVTPLILNIVKKAKDSANKLSVNAYGKATELAVATYLLENGNYPTTLDGLDVEYSSNEIVCNVKVLNEDGSIYLSECSVAGTAVKDVKTEDGWYHYGKMKFEVYSIGEQITYKGIEFYVIANSDESSDSVTLLKSKPLTVDEVNTYGAGHVNRYTYSNQGIAGNWNNNGYGGMTYYSSSTCGYPNGSSGSIVTEGCINDYDKSDIKYAVDAWAMDKFDINNLKEDSLGYRARLITKDELISNLGCTSISCIPSPYKSWVYNSDYHYWTMSQYNDSTLDVCGVDAGNGLYHYRNVYGYGFETVRPVITLLKSAL